MGLLYCLSLWNQILLLCSITGAPRPCSELEDPMQASMALLQELEHGVGRQETTTCVGFSKEDRDTVEGL